MMEPPAIEAAGLTPAQKRIWVGQQLHAGCPLYNMAFAFVFPAELDAGLFAVAWRTVAETSDALKTRISQVEGAVVRSEAAHAAPTRLPTEPGFETIAAFLDWCRQRCARPLPLDGDLVDSILVRIGDAGTGWYLNQHHLIADAWSTRLLYRSVGSVYEALSGNKADEAPPLAPYYATVAALDPNPDERTRALGHWASRAATPPIGLYGRSGPPTTTASRRLTLEIDVDRSRSLEALARDDCFLSVSEHLSRFALFATLLLSWLHRLSGKRSLAFDAPVSGRTSAAAKRALGLFIEVFPFVVDLDPTDSFRTLGVKCLQEALLLLRHGLPGTSASDGSTASNVVLNYLPGAFGTFAGIETQVDWIHPGEADSVHALRLQVHDFSDSGRYLLHFDCNESVLPDAVGRRALEHFDKLLTACLTDPDLPITSVDLVTDADRRSLAKLKPSSDHRLPDRTVTGMFSAQVDRTPGRIAVRQGGSQLSYAHLRERVDALGASLLKDGVQPGDRVVILCRRSIDAVVAILATLRVRAVYVPLEPSLAAIRLESLVRDSSARLIMVGDGVDDFIPPAGVNRLRVAAGVEDGRGGTFDMAEPGLGDLAYLIYTSGSTGQPKGVLVEHSGLADYLSWASREYVRGERLTVPLFTSLAVDLTITSLFLPLITGGTLEIYPESGGPVDTALSDVVRTNRVDFIKLTPSHLSLFVRMGEESSRIRRMVVGGEALKAPLAAAVTRQIGDALELYNEYGPTEAVVGCVVHRYDPERDRGATVPIGLPMDHVEVEVLDPAMLPVPKGVPGELWVSRYGLARGYHCLETLTAERFHSHPDREKAHRYRTGDLVRQIDSGELEYLGRLDRQVKVSGYRIEPAEIEDAMLSVPQVEQSAVIARRHTALGSGAPEEMMHCIRCGLPSNYPGAVFDDQSVCDKCRSYEAIRHHAEGYFGTPEDLLSIFEESARKNASEYDCMMLISGGKDSTYALCRLVEMGISVYAFTLDNGFISDSAKENIRVVATQLDVPVEFATTPEMNEIFRDSLRRFSNVCNGCFKTIYTLSMRRALELGIPIIVTGLSRGQMFETRLTEEMFRDGRYSPDEVDAAVLAARKIYHRVPDAVSRRLDVAFLEDDRVFERVRFVDFYRYIDIGLDQVYAYLDEQVPWVRPRDTGRSTNCLINDVGIYMHKQERGFHNYALPYSWDVRLGHKDRETALEELDDAIDVDFVRQTLTEIGYREDSTAIDAEQTVLHGFYVAAGDLGESALRRRLAERLPPPMIPGRLQRVKSIPMTPGGKLDEDALLESVGGQEPHTPYRAPEGPVEEYLVQLWQERLAVARVGADDDFFELGGTSLIAMEVMLQLCREYAIELPLETLFNNPRLFELARLAESGILADLASGDDAVERAVEPTQKRL